MNVITSQNPFNGDLAVAMPQKSENSRGGGDGDKLKSIPMREQKLSFSKSKGEGGYEIHNYREST